MPEEPEEQRYNDPLRFSELEDPSPLFASAELHPFNKIGFVKKWLLHRLRDPRVETMQFRSVPELLDLGSQGWRSDNVNKMALMLWFHDDAASMEHLRSPPGG